MANHVHPLVTPPSSVALSSFVHAFAQRYAVRRNGVRGGTGKLFEERFKSFVIRDELQFRRTHAYIELNPVRAHIVDAPDAYAWTTYRLHAGEPARSAVPSWLWTPSEWWLGFGATPADRASAHRAWIDECRPHDAALLTDEAQRMASLRAELASAGTSMRFERPDRTRVAESAARYAIFREF